jgi:MFS family permease
MTGMGIGAIVGSLVLAKLSGLKRKGRWLIATNLLWGLSVALFGLTETFLWAFLMISFMGFVSAINMSMNRSLVQLQVDQHMRGRIMSIDLMSHGLMPIGVLPIGYIAEHVSVAAALVTSGGILILTTVIAALALPAVRRIDTGYTQR